MIDKLYEMKQSQPIWMALFYYSRHKPYLGTLVEKLFGFRSHPARSMRRLNQLCNNQNRTRTESLM